MKAWFFCFNKSKQSMFDILLSPIKKQFEKFHFYKSIFRRNISSV